MRLDARIAALEQQRRGDPTLMDQWVHMLTTLSASCRAWGHEHPDEPAARLTDVDHEAIGREAAGYAARGIPATICDLIRLGQEAMDREEP